MEQEDENSINKREKRYMRSLKRSNKKNLILIAVLAVCICLLIVNNLVTYNYYGILNTEAALLKTKLLGKNSELKAPIMQTNESVSEQNNTSERNAQDKHEAIVSELKEKVDDLSRENENLKNNNMDIVEDNIELQNSLKLAAMAGIKPNNYERPPEITSRGSIRREKYIGEFKGTAYTPSKSECGNSKGITYSGKPIVPGTTVAVDTRYWPIGTVFYIKGIGYVTAMDTGSKIKGKYRFDIAVFDKDFAKLLGSRYWDVYLVKMGNGKIES